MEKNGIQMDNCNIVPYSPHLLMRYQAHVNTKYCKKSNSIKYLFKYGNKGPDRATVKIINGWTQDVDEIKNFKIVDIYLCVKLFGKLLALTYIIDDQLYRSCHFIYRSNNQLCLKMMIILIRHFKIMNL